LSTISQIPKFQKAYSVTGDELHDPRDELTGATIGDKHPDDHIWAWWLPLRRYRKEKREEAYEL